MIQNPYTLTDPVSDPRQFWGRELETSRIFSRIGAGRPQSVSLIGEPRIGKTSVIRYLQAPEVQKAHLDAPDAILVKAVEIPDELRAGPEAFIDQLSHGIAEQTGAGLEGSGYEAFINLLKGPSVSGLKLVLCLDDFHRITENPDYPMEFFSFLRSAANNYNVAYVTTSPLELQRLCVSRVVEESPFFNIFTNIPLRPLRPEAARQAVMGPSAAAGRPLAPHGDRIIAWTGTAPDDLRAGCRMVFDMLGERDRLGQKDWEAFEAGYLAEREPVFQERWDRMGPEFQETYVTLIGGKKVDRSRRYVVTELERRGYVGREADGSPIMSLAFASYAASVSGGNVPGSSKTGGWFRKFLR
jgi:serine/threonine-protein kinase